MILSLDSSPVFFPGVWSLPSDTVQIFDCDRAVVVRLTRLNMSPFGNTLHTMQSLYYSCKLALTITYRNLLNLLDIALLKGRINQINKKKGELNVG